MAWQVEFRAGVHLPQIGWWLDSILEIAFDSIQLSPRHESGFALRFPRIARIRTDRTIADIGSGDDDRAVVSRNARRARGKTNLQVEFEAGARFGTLIAFRMRVSPPPSSSPPVKVEIRPDVWLDSRRALWLADERRLVVADLHWGYAAAHRARGNLLPSWGDAEIERTLHALVSTYQPVEMIWLGDVVHAAAGRPAAKLAAR